jgi:hypothetical protein
MAGQIAPSPDRTQLGIGALASAFGLYFCLVGLGLLPEPSHRIGPLWLATFAGLAFLCAGISVTVRGFLGMDDKSRELPESAPLWMKTVYWLSGVAAASCLAAIGTWIAFGAGPRGFNISGPFSGPVGEGIGRAIFGIGTILTWLMVIALARAGAKKIFGKKSGA